MSKQAFVRKAAKQLRKDSQAAPRQGQVRQDGPSSMGKRFAVLWFSTRSDKPLYTPDGLPELCEGVTMW